MEGKKVRRNGFSIVNGINWMQILGFFYFISDVSIELYLISLDEDNVTMI
jgi:hypothetical protein